MIRLTPPSESLRGRVALPYSKSMLNRQLVLSHLAEVPIEVDEEDDRFARDSVLLSKALDDLKENRSAIHVRDAGTAMRFMTALCTISPGEWTLSGTDRMHGRPITALVESLRSIGAEVDYLGAGNCPPLRIIGQRLSGGSASIEGDVSSQFISALLMIGAHLEKGLDLQIEGTPLSRPYIEMTLAVMDDYGIHSSWQKDIIRVQSGSSKVDPTSPEADWSAAAFWYAMLAVAEEGEIELPGLRLDSPQGDKACIALFDRLGVRTESMSDGVILRRTPTVVGRFEADCRDFPDLAQALAFCCAAKRIACHLTGLETLPGKETDRIEAIRVELGKMGIDCQTDERSLSFDAADVLLKEDLLLSTYDDHRMAMAMSCLTVKGVVTLDDGSVVAKSYPGFFKEMERMGFGVERM